MSTRHFITIIFVSSSYIYFSGAGFASRILLLVLYSLCVLSGLTTA